MNARYRTLRQLTLTGRMAESTEILDRLHRGGYRIRWMGTMDNGRYKAIGEKMIDARQRAPSYDPGREAR